MLLSLIKNRHIFPNLVIREKRLNCRETDDNEWYITFFHTFVKTTSVLLTIFCKSKRADRKMAMYLRYLNIADVCKHFFQNSLTF